MKELSNISWQGKLTGCSEARYSFSEIAEQCDDLLDYGEYHLEEDRRVTHLFVFSRRSDIRLVEHCCVL